MKKVFSYLLSFSLAVSMFSFVGDINAKEPTEMVPISEETPVEVSTIETPVIEEVEEEVEQPTTEETEQPAETAEEPTNPDNGLAPVMGDDDEEIVQENAGSVGISKIVLSEKSSVIGLFDGYYADLVTLTATVYFNGYSDIPSTFDAYYPLKLENKFEINNYNVGSTNYSTHTKTFTIEFYGTATGTIPFSFKDSKYGKTYATYKLIVKKDPKNVNMSKKAITISEGQTATVKATMPSGTASYDKYYYSSNSNIATVNQDGVITAKKEGTVTINCMAYNGAISSKPTTVTVKPGPYRVTVTGKPYLNSMTKGKSFTVKPTAYDKYGNKVTLTSFTYTSSNPNVATISTKGKIVAKNYGTTTIKVMAHNGKYYSWTLTVGAPPTSVYISTGTTMSAGQSKTIGYTLVYPAGTSYQDRSITVTSSKSSVIRVDNAVTGKITALKPGTATITIKTANGKKATIKITVY